MKKRIMLGMALSGLSACVVMGDSVKTFTKEITNKDLVSTVFPKTPEELHDRLKRVKECTLLEVEKILSIAPQDRTFSNTVQAFDEISVMVYRLAASIEVLDLMAGEERMRKAASEANKELEAFMIELFSGNKRIFTAYQEYLAHAGLFEKRTAEKQYFIDEAMKGFAKEGFDLPLEQQATLKHLRKELAVLSQEFSNTISRDNREVSFLIEELDGLAPSFIAAQKRSADGRLLLGIDQPTVTEVLENASNSETRRKLWVAAAQRGYPTNQEVLKNIVKLRGQIAKLLGYESYAHLDIDDQMAESPEKVTHFINQILARSEAIADREFALLKKNLPQGVVLTADGKFRPWDSGYVVNEYKKQHLNADEKAFADYFPQAETIKAMLSIYEKFLGLTFIYHTCCNNVWHEDVSMIEVHDAATKELLGFILLDLQPREGKYNHAAACSVVRARFNENGIREPAVVVVVANFPKPLDGKPALLKRNDVKTFFHEFGHAMHNVLGATRMAGFSGTSVKTDFVEMPSQMFEEWMTDHDILKMVTKHVKTGERMPDAMIKTLIDLKNFLQGSSYQRQAIFSLYSLELFKDAEKDPHELYKALSQQYRKHITLEPEDHFETSFGHLTGYASKYYSYLWSKVYALDLFELIKERGLLNPQIGRRYATMVIGRGGSVPPMELITEFLGRPPSDEAFFKNMRS